jgi:hypothetical protein
MEGLQRVDPFIMTSMVRFLGGEKAGIGPQERKGWSMLRELTAILKTSTEDELQFLLFHRDIWRNRM